MRALVIGGLGVAMLASPAFADSDDACATDDGRPRRFRGAPIDLDVKNADIHDVYRLLGDVGRVNIVIPEDIKAKVTLKLKRVPWDQVACTVAAVHKLVIGVNGNVYLVTKREPPKSSR
jgi:type IV pilus assembly protein PilQ